MTKVYCYRENCINRSERKSQLKNQRVEPLYRCKKDVLVITGFTEPHHTGLCDEVPGVCECLNFADRSEY